MHHRAINAPVRVRGRRKSLMLGTVLAFAMILTTPVCAQGVKLPSGGQVTAGQASVATSGNSTTITQSSGKAIINWTDFSIGQGGTVQFDNGTGATLNRVTGGSVSSIDGLLSATGSVYLINPNGVIIGKSGVVRTDGSFVASTLDLGDAAFLKGGDLTFDGASSAAVVNLGKVGALGGDVALIAAHVENQGTLAAANGSIGLLAGHQVLMRDQSVDGGKFAVLVGGSDTSVTNTGAITAAAVELRAAGGNIYALAGNTQGVINATGVTTKDGRVFLTAGDGGSVTVSGTQIAASTASGDGGAISITGQTINVASDAVLDASATSATGQGGKVSVVADMTSGALTFAGTALARGGLAAGNGGSVETSGATVDFDGAVVDTSAGHGTTGNWLTDPYDLTIDIAAAQTIQSNLATTSVTLQTTATGTSAIGTPNAAGVGDITVLAPISWNSANTLTFDAYHGINIDAPLTVKGAGKVVLKTNDGGTGGDYNFGLTSQGFTGSLSFTGSGAGLTINGQVYTLLTSMSGIADMNGNSGHYYALATSLDTVGTVYPNAVVPIFQGTFTGLGHTVSNLTVDATPTAGLFGSATGGAVLRDVGVTGGSVTGRGTVGLLVGGLSGGTVVDSYSTGQVTGGEGGGLIGDAINGSSVSNVFSTAAVTGGGDAGGLIAYLTDSTLSNAHATGLVIGGADGTGGGLVGMSYVTTITNVWASGQVNAQAGAGGGLIGFSENDTISNAHATGTVVSMADTGGLIGTLSNSNLSDAYATGAVSANEDAGGLVGYALSGATITDSYATGSVTATQLGAGGLVGLAYHAGAISNSYAIGQATAPVAADALIGESAGTTFANLYYNSDTAGISSTAGTGLTTAQLQGTLPTGFGAAWATGAGLYPYLVSFWSSTPQAISGTAYNSNSTAAAGVSVGIYAGGTLLGGGPASTGANGAYYELVAAGTVGASTPVGTTVTLNSLSAPIGLTYSDQQTLSGGNVTLAGVTSGTTAETTSQANLSGLMASLASTFGSAYATITPKLAGLPLTITGTSGSGFTLDQALATTGSLSLAATGGPLYVDANISAGSTHALTLASAVVLQADTTLTGSTVTTASTVDGAHALTVTGNAAFDSTVGGSAQLTSLGISGTSLLDGGSVTTTGSQTYSGAVTLGADNTLTGASVRFVSTVNGPHVLDVMASGPVTFLANIGGSVPLSGLTVTGSQVALPNAVTTGAGGLSITTTQGDLAINQALSTTGNIALAAKGGTLTLATPMSFSGSSGITLDAYQGINIDVPLTIAGTGKVVLTTNDGGTGGDYVFGANDSLSFTGPANAGQALTINGASYTLLYSLSDLEGTSFRSGHFALAKSLDATGFTGSPTGSVTDTIAFGSVLEGLGHTVSNLTIHSTQNWAGLISFNDGTVRDIGLVGGSISGGATVGGLVAVNNGTLSYAYSTAAVSGASQVGGLVGDNSGTITNAYATGSVTGVDTTGGLVGLNDGSITNAYATGAVAGQNNGTGGLIGSGYGSLTDVYATGAVMGQNSTGGLIGYDDGGTVTNGYYDASTTGKPSGTQSDGSVGMTTAQLQGALPTGFAASVWSTGAGLYPYLNWQYATTPQAITGTAVSLTPTTSVAGSSVNIYLNGSDIAATTVGANGYYYALVAGNTIKSNTPYGTTLSLPGDSGVDAMTYSDTHVASATSVATGNTILGRNEVAVSQPTLSALFAGMGSAFGPAEMAYLKTTAAFSYQDFYAYAPTFTIDQAVDVTSVFKITGLNYTGKIIDAAPITVEPGATLMWTSDGALAINAPMTVKGAGDINLHYDYFQTTHGGVANPLDFSFGNSGALSFLTSTGGVATANQGGQFVLNNVEYTLIYSMAQLDSIDGVNGVTGANEGIYGAGLNGNYALANTLNAAGTIYSRDLINNFEGTFEGLNNSINNLTIKDTGATSDSVGLFGAFHGTVRDINLVNVSVSDNDSNNNPNVGGLAGYSDGNIYDVSVSGDVNATNRLSVNVGGVVGYAPNGTIYNARASDTVEGSIGDVVGGLVGLSYAANISQSSATGNISSPGATMGGLVGFTEPGTTITASYATGTVSGGPNSLEGGLVGYNLGEIYQSYATGLVTTSGTSGLDGLVGSNNGGVVSSYWDTDTSGQARSAGGSGLTTAQLQSGTLPAGFSATIWSATPGQNPKLKVAAQ